VYPRGRVLGFRSFLHTSNKLHGKNHPTCMSTRHIGKCNSKILLAPNFEKREMGLLHCFEIWDVTVMVFFDPP
jgi:hypothetical protein